MGLPRFSVAGLLGLVGLFAVGLTCLLNASSPLAGVPFSASLLVLALTPLGLVYRRDGRRAFWLGIALGGWSYAVLGLGPWFSDSVRPRLVTTRLLVWAYPIVIHEARQASQARRVRSYVIKAPIHGADIVIEALTQGPVDVLVQEEGKDRSSPLVEDVEVTGGGASGGKRGVDAKLDQVTIRVDPGQLARLEQARAGKAQFVIRRHVAKVVGPFAGLWSSPPVQADDFERVGHVFCGIACALAGGSVGRYFHSTRDLPSPRGPGLVDASLAD